MINKDHELFRRTVWMKAWCATANANDCKSHKTATLYADEALKAFDSRFEPLEDDVIPKTDYDRDAWI